MPSTHRSVRQGAAVVLSAFLIAASLKVGAEKPSAEKAAKAFRERRGRDLLGRLRAGEITFGEARERWLAENGAEPPWRRGRRAPASDRGAKLTPRFHAGGLAPVDPVPVNPLLDPLGLFEGEAGEEPPIGPFPRIFLSDFDGDGDLDVFAGDKYGYVRYLENIGSDTDPVFEERTGAASPTGALDVSCDAGDPMDTSPCGPSAPMVADLDGDDDLDLFVGQGFRPDDGGPGGRVLFFENDGSGTLSRNDADNPFDGFVFGQGFATPTLVDIDGDDDLDAFVGTKYESFGPYGGELYFLRNDGDDENPSFSDQSDVVGVDPFAGRVFFPVTAPFFANVDGDGDLDAFIGDGYKVQYFRNDTVLPGPPVFPAVTGYDHPLGDAIAVFAAPVFGDLDGDGDLDAFVAHGIGKAGYDLGYVQYFENTGTPTDPGFLAPGERLELADVDGDGDLDALVSHYLYSLEIGPRTAVKASGDPPGPISIWYFENVGTEQEPSWQLRTGLDNPFCTFNDSYTGGAGESPSVAPTVGNLDGDALLDAVVGRPDGTLAFLEDDGTGQLLPVSHPLDAIDFGDAADPQLVDVNGDGELDLVVGYVYEGYDVMPFQEGRVAVFLNPTGPDGLDAPQDMVLDFGSGFGRPAPVVADLDGDGDLDMLVGGYIDGAVSQTLFVENTGTLEAPAFAALSAQEVEALVATPNSPAVGDVNGDGYRDLLIGNLAGVELFLTEIPIVEVTKEVTGGDLVAGGTVEYTISITNVGSGAQPDDPANPELTDTLPPELTLTSAMVIAGPGAVTTSGNTVRYDGTIGVGDNVVIVIEATIGPAASIGTAVDNQAIASVDANGDGTNDTAVPSDDPTTAAPSDPTTFLVGVADIFEIPTLSRWGAGLLAGLLSLLGLFGLRRFDS